MSEMTRASAIAQLRRHVREHIEIRRNEMEMFEREMRLLEDLAQMEDLRLYFHKKKLEVSWTGGTMPFKRNGIKQFKTLWEISLAGPDGITHADLAQNVYDDPVADVKNVTHALARKMEAYRCPFKLEHDSKRFWLESVEQK